MWDSPYSFVNNFSNLNPRIRILIFLDSAKVGLLKNVHNQFSRCFGSREMSKTKVGTFFWNTLYMADVLKDNHSETSLARSATLGNICTGRGGHRTYLLDECNKLGGDTAQHWKKAYTGRGDTAHTLLGWGHRTTFTEKA